MNIPKTMIAALLAVFTIAGIQNRAVAQEESQEEKPNKIAKARAEGTTVKWEIKAPYSAATLTVSTPEGDVIRQEFPSGRAPQFSITEKNEKLPDGTYTYELRLSPVISEDVKKSLKESRERGSDAETVRALRKRGQLPAEPLVESGSFVVLNGNIVVAGTPEPRSQRKVGQSFPLSRGFSNEERSSRIRKHHLSPVVVPDQVIPDDLIVQGSLCVGFDCVNNEDFSFDTIRLRENNLRIKFDDTSVTAGYPNNDWQLIANDSASGGASNFSIQDTTSAKLPFVVSAGASTNSIFIDSTGRVGLRTSTPVLDMHANTSNTPGIRLEQNNSGGWTAQTFDIGANEANFFIRDVTGGSRLPLRIRPGAPTSSLDISADGRVGFGTASPRSKVDIKQTVDSFIGGIHLRRSTTNDTWALVTGSDNNLYMGYANSASLADAVADFTIFPLVVTANNRVGIRTPAPDQALSVNGDASKTGGGSWLVFSDERLKTIKGYFNSGLKAVMQLQPVRYEYNRHNALNLEANGEHVGFGAQSLQKIIPEAVTRSANGYLQVNNDPIIWTMLNAIKEQQQEIEQLKTEIRQLRTASRRKR